MMKNCLRSTVLMLAVVAMCTNANASILFSDDENTKALWHLDGPFIPWFGIYSLGDDVSFRGGNVYDRQLRLEAGGTGAPDATTPGTGSGALSPNGTPLLQFDGVDDDATGFFVWQDVLSGAPNGLPGNKKNFSIDIMVDQQAAIPNHGERMGIISTTDWSIFLFNLSGTTYTIFEALDSQGGNPTSNLIFTPSAGVFVWDDIHVEVIGEDMSLTSNGVTVTGTLEGGIRNTDPTDSNIHNSRVILGRSFAGGNHFQGLIDEVRIANIPIPEPASLMLASLAGLAFVMRRRK